jgi:hypothetical protein
MSSHPITREEAEEAYDVAVLKQDESGLARCYQQLYEAARRVGAIDWPLDNAHARAAMESLRKLVASEAPPLRRDRPGR